MYFLFCLWEGLRSNDTAVAMSMSSAQIMTPKFYFAIIETRAYGKIVDFMTTVPESKQRRKLLHCVQLFSAPWTIQSVEFSRPEYWSGLPFPSPRARK